MKTLRVKTGPETVLSMNRGRRFLNRKKEMTRRMCRKTKMERYKRRGAYEEV